VPEGIATGRAADHLVLLAPSANRVYAAEADRLAAAELTIMLGGPVDAPPALVETETVAGVSYLRLPHPHLDEATTAALSRMSAVLAVFRREGDYLVPIPFDRPDWFDDDLVGIPKYPGKTNEQFTRLLVNVTAASARRALSAEANILDPLCGRGTTLSTGWTLGFDVAGVEADRTAVEAYDAFLRGYLRRKRIRHRADFTPVRREGRSLGRRLEVSVSPDPDRRALSLTVFTGDSRQSAALFGRRRFDLVVTDLPYGIVYRGSNGSRADERWANDLVAEALPVWARQLKRGGALGLSWNTYTMTRERLSRLVTEAGLTVCTGPGYADLGHRVDAAIHRDVLVAVDLGDGSNQ
jgi:hypothetical protein